MGERFIYIVRHGQYHSGETAKANIKGHLNRRGKVQANRLGKYLRDITFNNFYVSTAERALETAEIISAYIHSKNPQHIDKNLKETIPNVPAILRGKSKVSRSELSENKKRLDTAFAKIFKKPTKEDQHDLVVCHGNVMRYLIVKFLGLPESKWMSFATMNHCSVTKIRITKSGYTQLVEFNNSEFLPKHMRTIE